MVSVGNRKTNDNISIRKDTNKLVDEYDYTKGGERDPSRLLPTDSTTGFHPSWGNYGDDSLGECGVPMHHRWHGMICLHMSRCISLIFGMQFLPLAMACSGTVLTMVEFMFFKCLPSIISQEGQHNTTGFNKT